MNRIKPVCLLAGGGARNLKDMTAVLERALQSCGKNGPTVAYVGTANGDNFAFYTAMKALLHAAGAQEVPLVHLAKKNADVAEARQLLRKADAVLLSGGEVEDGMRWLEYHGLIGFLNELRSDGRLFMGVSAGSIMMGAHWVRWDDPDDDTTAALFDCLGFVRMTFDTHAENEAWKELKTALTLQGSGAVGYGIPTNGAVCVDDEGKITALEKPLLRWVNKDGTVAQTIESPGIGEKL